MIRLFLAGEGLNELGDWWRTPQYRHDPPLPGVIEALLRQIRDDGWEVAGATGWKDIRKFRTRQKGEKFSAETRNVMGAALAAWEAGCDVFVFIRDRDGTRSNPNQARQDDIEEGIRRALEEWSEHLSIVGGVAIIKLESWLLAIIGQPRSEEIRRPEEEIASLGVLTKDKETAAMVACVEANGLEQVPDDAESLRRWLERARQALGTADEP